MKLYNPLKKDSFFMQFGFNSPNWRRYSLNNLERQNKEVKKKKPKTLMEFLNAKTEKRKDK